MLMTVSTDQKDSIRCLAQYELVAIAINPTLLVLLSMQWLHKLRQSFLANAIKVICKVLIKAVVGWLIVIVNSYSGFCRGLCRYYDCLLRLLLMQLKLEQL